jgi:(4S)-4-hydroxy-5-phosphonooxypentane-2,3-dione isomerase
MFCIAVTYTIREGEEEKVREYLKMMTEHTRQEPGNVMYIAHQSNNNPRQFFLYEQYHSEDDLKAHREAPYFAEYVVNGLMPLAENRVAEFYTEIA